MSTCLTNNVTEALKAGYIAAKTTPEINDEIGDISLDEMKESLSDWKIMGVERDGKTIGMAISKNGECHFCINPKFQGRWLTRGFIKEINQRVDCRFTTVNASNHKKQLFVEKIGFHKIMVKGNNVVYQLNKLKYGD